MNAYLLDPNVCPASLDENDEPTHPSGSAHRWDETTTPVTCAECGTEKSIDLCWCGREVDQHIDYDTDPPPIYCAEQKCRCGNGTPAKPEDRFFQPQAGVVAHVPGNECTTKCDGMACCYGCGTCFCECHH